MFCVVENVHQKHVDWINFILRHKRWSTNRLASEAEVDPSTLSRLLKDPGKTRTLNSYSVEKIEKASGVPAFETSIAEVPRGLAERESDEFEARLSGGLNEAVRALKGERNEVDAWELGSRAVELAGYLPGDTLIVDMSARPEPGELVCAQVYDLSGGAKTIFRIYEHPFLVAATTDPSLFKPLLIDNERVVVRGVVTASFRQRRVA